MLAMNYSREAISSAASFEVISRFDKMPLAGQHRSNISQMDSSSSTAKIRITPPPPSPNPTAVLRRQILGRKLRAHDSLDNQVPIFVNSY